MKPLAKSAGTVLHVAQAVETGVAYVLEDHIRHQLSEGWRVFVACPGGSLSQIATNAGATVLEWQALRNPGPSVVSEARDLRRIVRDVDPDLVHLHSAKAGLVGRMVVRGRRPTVFTPHAWSWLAADGATRALARLWERWGSRWADAIVCLSAGEIAEAREVGIRIRPELIPNDVPIALLRSLAPPTRAEARAAVGMAEEDGLLVVCAARLAPQKGQDVLLSAWTDVVQRVPGVRLAIVGDGPALEELRTLAADVDGVHFAGMQDRAATLAWIKAADVVVCPSRYEGMSLVPLEAAALGVPVVASDVEGMRSDLPSTSRLLVRPGSTHELAEALAGTLADAAGREEGSRHALAWAESTASAEGACARTSRLYARLLQGGPADQQPAGGRPQ